VAVAVAVYEPALFASTSTMLHVFLLLDIGSRLFSSMATSYISEIRVLSPRPMHQCITDQR